MLLAPDKARATLRKRREDYRTKAAKALRDGDYSLAVQFGELAKSITGQLAKLDGLEWGDYEAFPTE